MENKEMKSGCSLIDVATFNKLVTDNECLKLRVKALEKSLQEALKEIFALQKCMSTLISAELRIESEEDRGRAETIENNCSHHRSRFETTHSGEKPEPTETSTKSSGRGYRECKLPKVIGLNSNDGCTDRYRDRSPKYSYKRRNGTPHRSLEYPPRSSNKTERTGIERRRNESRPNSQPINVEQLKRHRSTDRFTLRSCAGRTVEAFTNSEHIELHQSPHRREFRRGTPPNSYRELRNERVEDRSSSQRNRSSEQSSRREGVTRQSIHERRSADSSAVDKDHLPNFGYSGKASAFDKRIRNDREKYSHRLNRPNKQLDDRSTRETGSSDHLHNGRRTELTLPPNENHESMRRPQMKIPRPSNDCPARIVNNLQQCERSPDNRETKGTSQPFNNGRLASDRQTESVGGVQSRVLVNPMITETFGQNASAKKVESDGWSVDKITLWTHLDKVESTVGSAFLGRMHSTPMKFINDLMNYRMLSPLQNTPILLKNGALKNIKIAPMPLSLNMCNETTENETSRDVEMTPAAPVKTACTLSRKEDWIQSEAQDNVEIQTVIKTNEAEHGVFKRQRRKI